jgi:hypothetical protein
MNFSFIFSFFFCHYGDLKFVYNKHTYIKKKNPEWNGCCRLKNALSQNISTPNPGICKYYLIWN